MSRIPDPPWQPCTASGWRKLQVKRVFSVTLGKMLQSRPATSSDAEVAYLKAQHVQWDGVHIADLPTMWASEAEINGLLVKQGDLLVCEGGEVGRSAIVDTVPSDQTIIQNALHLVRGKNATEPRFLNNLLRHAAEQGWFDVICNRSTIAHFTVGKFKEMWIWLPDNSQQRAIVDYLDRETARLDALVAAKERVLGLLAEKRRTLITRAVTRGLDPCTPVRDSGISWLGDIPAHWKISKFTWSIFIIEGQVDPRIEPYVNMPLIAPNHLESGTGRLLRVETAADQGAISGKYLCQPGDVIYSKIRPALRKATMAAERCLCSADMYPLRSRKGIRPEFLLFFLLSEPFSTWAVLESSRVAMPKINREAISGIRIPLPSLDEQCAIIEHINGQVAKLDKLYNSIEYTVTLLKERRAALVNAAVTGKIDVGITA